ALGDPQYDPHGDPIPTAAGEIEEAELVSLADVSVGTKLELRQVGTQDPARLRYFAEQGLTPGVLLTITDRQPFNGPTTIGLVPSGDPLVVGRELALLLWCREVPITDHGYASRLAGGRRRTTRARVAPRPARTQPRRGLPHRPDPRGA